MAISTSKTKFIKVMGVTFEGEIVTSAERAKVEPKHITRGEINETGVMLELLPKKIKGYYPDPEDKKTWIEHPDKSMMTSDEFHPSMLENWGHNVLMQIWVELCLNDDNEEERERLGNSKNGSGVSTTLTD